MDQNSKHPSVEGAPPIYRTPKEARAHGSPAYFTGKPCPHGHTATRYTRNSSCSICEEGYALSSLSGVLKKLTRKDGWELEGAHADRMAQELRKEAQDLIGRWRDKYGDSLEYSDRASS